MRINRFFRRVSKTLTKNMGTGLAVGAMIGVAVTCYFVAKETPEAKKNLEELDEESGTLEKAKTAVKSYKKSIASALVTEGMIFGSNFANKKEIAALTAFGMSQIGKRAEVEKATKDILGDKSGEVQKKIVETKLHQPEVLETAIYTGHGNVLCYEPLTGHFFYASQNYILNEALSLDKDSASYGYEDITLNDWLDALHLPECLLGENCGWAYNPDGNSVDIGFDSGVVEGLPYLSIRYKDLPAEFGISR